MLNRNTSPADWPMNTLDSNHAETGDVLRAFSSADTPGLPTLKRLSGRAKTSEMRQIIERIQILKAKSVKYKSSNYDISDRCNLTCEGCLYFSGRGNRGTSIDSDAAKWDAFFASESARGINYAYLAGAEPALEPKILKIASQHIPNGVIYTNGSVKIDRDLPYRIHISLWGYGERSAALRGADINLKALRNFEGQSRAVAIMTINAQNIDDIDRIARQCDDHGIKLSFSFFSSTTEYLKIISDHQKERDAYSRLSDSRHNLKMRQADFAHARERIGAAAQNFPNTVIASKAFYQWSSHERMPFVYNDQGIAENCGFRSTSSFKHFDVRRQEDDGKCCSPNIDCSDCRAYAMASASFLKARHDYRSPDRMREFLETWEFWARLFLPMSDMAHELA
jgi:MoaA/NifB/PqqE/SkfB family radical SAM enzyme